MRNKIINCSRTCALLLLVPFSYYSYYAKCRPTTTEVASTARTFHLPPIEISVTAILVEFYCIPSTTALCSCMCVLWDCVGVRVCIIIAVLLIVLWVSHVCYAAWALLSYSLREIFIKNAKALTLIVTYFNALAILLAFTRILALPGDAPRGRGCEDSNCSGAAAH